MSSLDPVSGLDHLPLVELRVWEVGRVLPALRRVASQRSALADVPGLRFAKLLGTGTGRGFTPRDVHPHRWALLTVWDGGADGERHAEAFDRGPVAAAWDDAARERLLVRMTPLTARGRWAGVEPFGGPHAPRPWTGAVAAVTRARLRPTRAWSFWRAVPPVVQRLHEAEGMRAAFGIGEAPVGLQGTFSLWRSGRDLAAFAYRDPVHRAVVARTEPARWYAEDLFARLAVHGVDGTLDGVAP